jgi:threonine synthase
LSVKGEFDDCQRLAKEMFADRELVERFNLCSANSINVGRLLPQSVYYAHTSRNYSAQHGKVSDYIIPTGNLGNAFACVWAKQMGFPIGRLILATNANRTIPDYLDSGNWEPRGSVATLASAMDVGNPSNMERLRQLWGNADSLRARLTAVSVTDAQIREQIRAEYERSGVIVCPHTATGLHVYRGLPEAERRDAHWVVAATAHPAKFDTIVEPLIGTAVAVPDELARLLALPSQFATIAPVASEVIRRL